MEFLLPLLRPYFNIFNFRAIQSNPFNGIALLFTAIAFYQAYRGLSLGLAIRENWAKIMAEPLTRHKKIMAEHASFFIAVPLGVLLHELGHAIFVWLFGGRVVEFGFFFFWGYVLPDRTFPAMEQFIISSAGTWMNLIYALLIWLAIGRTTSRVIRYFALRAVRFQIFFALIYYPIFTLILSIGDWRVIYDFDQTPLLSAITAVFHAAILLGHWWLDRRGYYDMMSFENPAEREAYTSKLATAEAQPDNLQAQDELISHLLRGGNLTEARKRIKKLLRTHPDWADGRLTYALILAGNKQRIPHAAVREAETALELGLSDRRQEAIAHHFVGRAYSDMERYQRALPHVNNGLIALTQSSQPHEPLRLQLYYLRGELHRRLNNPAAAEADLRQALTLAKEQQQDKLAQQISKILSTLTQIHHH